MDADQLRLVLLVVGMVLVAAIYLWDRYKRSRRRLKGLSLRQARKIRKELGLDQEEQPVPSFSATDREIVTEPGVSIRLVKKEEKQEAKPEPEAVVRPAPEPEPEIQPELDFSADEQDDYLHIDPLLQENMPQLVVQIGVIKPEGVFSGPEIMQAMVQADLKPGAMEIFHRYDRRYSDRVLFSVANMVEPGHFPFDDMEAFTSPGLLFFTQLPGIRDGLEIYSEMLFAANQVAESLGGVLQDENRSTLTRQSIQHTRDLIAEHRRKMRLALKVKHA